jgi:hypothetical protein
MLNESKKYERLTNGEEVASDGESEKIELRNVFMSL